jgi:hypothetical protein
MASQKPATPEVVAKLIAQAISDPEFREEILKNPDGAIRKEGFKADDSTIDLFKALANSDFKESIEKIEKSSPLNKGEATGSA